MFDRLRKSLLESLKNMAKKDSASDQGVGKEPNLFRNCLFTTIPQKKEVEGTGVV